MGTSARIRFHIDFLEMDLKYDGSYSIYRDYLDLPTIWQGNFGDKVIKIVNVHELISYLTKNPPGYKAVQTLYNILTSTNISDIVVYPDPEDGYPKEYRFVEEALIIEYGD